MKRSTWVLWLFVVAIIIVVFYGAINHRRPKTNIPPGMQKFVDMQDEASRKRLKDVDHIEFEVSWQNEKIIVTDPIAKRLILEGMQKAVQTKEQYGNLVERVTVYWKDGSRTKTYGFSRSEGGKFAFSKEFCEGFNKAIEAEGKSGLKSGRLTKKMADNTSVRKIRITAWH